MRLTGGAIADAMAARVVAGDPSVAIDGFSIDTRTMAPRDLYIAIRGARLDGHAFASAALASGASGVVASDPVAIAALAAARPAGLVLAVDDTTAALQALALHVRRASGARVVAITGSAGKTTTKETVGEMLAARYRVFRNRGNLNNHIGLPLSLLELRHEPEIAVVELGMNHAGELRTLVAVAEPDVRVWTNVGDAHLGFFASVDALASAKAEILERARPDDALVANADDPRVMSHARRFEGPTVTFGFAAGADVRAVAVEDLGLDGTRARVTTPAGATVLTTALVGRGHLANVLAAVATAMRFDVPLEAIAACTAALRPAAHRGEVLRLPGGVSVVDDSYNSSPSALAAALALVAGVHGSARKVAFLGEMLELGAHAVSLHAESGARAAGTGLDLLVTVGGAAARALGDAARAAGLPAAAVRHVESSAEAADLVPVLVRAGDLVLVKGSRGVATDRVVDRLKAEFA